MDVLLGADAIDRLLHLAVTTVAPFHGVGGGRKQFVVEKRQRLVQVGRAKLVQDLADLLETANALAQLGQLRQGGVGAAATIEQAVDFLHDRRASVRNCGKPRVIVLQRPPFGRRQIVLDEQIDDAQRDPQFSVAAACRWRTARLAAAVDGRPRLPRRLSRGQLFADLGHRPQDRLGQFLDDVEFADLVGDVAEHRPQRLGIQGRAIGGDAPQRQAAQPQRHPEAPEEGRDVRVIGIVIEHLVEEPFEGAVVHDGQDAKRPIVQLVGRDVPREVSQAPVEIGRPHLPGRLFSPRPPPSSGWWRRGQTRGDRATDANWRLDRASRPPRRVARPRKRRDGCSGLWARRSRTCPR